jgi:hypothetical protein
MYASKAPWSPTRLVRAYPVPFPMLFRPNGRATPPGKIVALLSLRETHSSIEGIFRHWRDRYQVASKNADTRDGWLGSPVGASTAGYVQLTGRTV